MDGSRRPGTIIHWNGSDWSNVTSPFFYSLYSVFVVDSNNGWAVGDYGTIIRYFDSEWIPEFPTAIMPLLLALTLGLTIVLTKTASKKNRKMLLAKA